MPGLCPAGTQGQVGPGLRPRAERTPQSKSPSGTRRPATAGFVLRGHERLETDAGEAAAAVGAGTDPAGLYSQLCQTSPKKPDREGRYSRTVERCSLGGCSPRGETAQSRWVPRWGWERPAASCDSALAQDTSHVPRAGGVGAGTLQGLPWPANGGAEQKEQGKGLERSKSSHAAKAQLGEGTDSTPGRHSRHPPAGMGAANCPITLLPPTGRDRHSLSKQIQARISSGPSSRSHNTQPIR